MLEDVRLKALDYHRRKRIVAEKASKAEFSVKGRQFDLFSRISYSVKSNYVYFE